MLTTENEPEVREPETADALTREIRELAARGSKHLSSAIRIYQRIGMKLERLKLKVGHGRFLGVVRERFPDLFGVRQAQRYMAMYADKKLAQKEKQGTIYDESACDTTMSQMDIEYGVKVFAGVEEAETDSGKSRASENEKPWEKVFEELYGKMHRMIADARNFHMPPGIDGLEKKDWPEEWMGWVAWGEELQEQLAQIKEGCLGAAKTRKK